MILFSPAKINIGLKVTGRRADGFHNLQSIMFPTGLCDIIEIRETGHPDPGIDFSQSGITLEKEPGKNLCILAYEKLAKETHLHQVEVHLHKQIPVGAGLGGGSSNATTTLKGLNSIASNPVSHKKIIRLAKELGSDCPFFLHDQAMVMEGRGEILSQSDISLKQMYLLLLFPKVHISTAEAYSEIQPGNSGPDLREIISQPITRWKNTLVNDFEKPLFKKHPRLEMVKNELYKLGAIYASMSGSGSSIYGIFNDPCEIPGNLEQFVVWKGII